jgi:Fe-S oxidoreductase
MLPRPDRNASPRWRGDAFLSGRGRIAKSGQAAQSEVVLLVDTFNNYFEPDNARAALAVLEAAGYRVHLAQPAEDQDGNARPLCCGRTFLASGLVEQARAEAQRTIAALQPYVARGLPIIGLEPSCLYTLRDEFKSMLPGAATEALAAQAQPFEEFLAAEHQAGRLALKLQALPQKKALLHGYCHQKAFGAMPAVEQVLRLVPELIVETVESSCCGMAGNSDASAIFMDIS